MNKQFIEISEKINALSFRERLMVIVTVVVLFGFIWWNLFALPLLDKTKRLHKKTKALETEIITINATAAAIRKRIEDGVFKTKQQKLTLLKQELRKVNELLEGKPEALIEPAEMFELMQQLIFAESKLKLTGMKRKEVKSIFSSGGSESNPEQQPEIYRHVLQMSFEGKFESILKYIQKLESLEWKLIWDQITLKTNEYPVIAVDIEISTLSDNKSWVGF